jgi:hypothetical protein
MSEAELGKSSMGLPFGAALALFALISIGCRGYESSCSGRACSGAPAGAGGEDTISVSGTGGNAGDAGSTPVAGAGAGEGGALPESVTPQCSSNADCDDGATCNGSERCVRGACAAGKPVACGPNLTCVERGASNACEFVTQGPWLSFYQGVANVKVGIGLFGISTPYATSVEPIELSQGTIDTEGKILWDHQWSPDGRYLVLNVAGEHRALYWVEVDRGVPSVPELIPDVPQDLDQLQLVTFAKDKNQLLAKSDGLLIDIRFDAAGPHAAIVAEGQQDISNASYCAGAKVALLDNALVQLDSPNTEPRLIADSVLSPDARRLLAAASGGLEWQECSLSGKSHPVALPLPNADTERTFSWAPDSRHVLVYDNYDETLELSLVDLDATEPKAALLWHASDLDPDDSEASFSPDSDYLLVAKRSAWSLVAVTTGLETTINLPIGASDVSWAGDANSLLFQRSLAGSASATWWLGKTNTTATAIHSSSDPSLRLFVRVEYGFALALADEGGGTQISLVDLNHPELARRKLLAKPIAGELSSPTFAPDGTGAVFERRLLDQTDMYWLSLAAGSEGTLIRLSKTDSAFCEFQPWQR